MPSCIPDRIEPVVAHRVWSVSDNDELCSLGWSPLAWKPFRPLIATHLYYSNGYLKYRSKWLPHSIDNCEASVSRWEEETMPEPELFKCGIHAMKSLNHYKTFYGGFCIKGKVYLWGLIIEHEKGYRAEYAYPKCLYLDGVKDDTIRMIASNYRIPAVEQPAMEPQPHFNSLVDLQRDTYNAISGYTGV